VRKLLVGLVVLLVASAFVGGYWPQRERVARSEAEGAEARRLQAEAQSKAQALDAQVRLGRLFGQYLALADAVGAANYGEAQSLSSSFFDRVREEATLATDAPARAALDAVLMRRDAVTAGLARGEASVREVLVPIERELRRALAWPLPALATPPPAVPPTPGR
jgi:hypothetical protein